MQQQQQQQQGMGGGHNMMANQAGMVNTGRRDIIAFELQVHNVFVW